MPLTGKRLPQGSYQLLIEAEGRPAIKREVAFALSRPSLIFFRHNVDIRADAPEQAADMTCQFRFGHGGAVPVDAFARHDQTMRASRRGHDHQEGLVGSEHGRGGSLAHKGEIGRASWRERVCQYV